MWEIGQFGEERETKETEGLSFSFAAFAAVQQIYWNSLLEISQFF